METVFRYRLIRVAQYPGLSDPLQFRHPGVFETLPWDLNNCSKNKTGLIDEPRFCLPSNIPVPNLPITPMRKPFCPQGHDRRLPHGLYIVPRVSFKFGKVYSWIENRCARCDRENSLRQYYKKKEKGLDGITQSLSRAGGSALDVCR